ncbi:hypothetical protein JOC86_002951 [Bacillus pakistanensis]|uniref:Uncharacterized protein n=2 Tax=Rossellomorea pakistanensis TaxID=992288 RepID=A0ABS2NF55_9BACI|nr:hypothetical protein [Bacillus pakistanensis]
MDYGRVYDYYDDYSAYMDIDSIQLADGIPRSSGDEECLHLFGCSNCLVEKPINIPFTTI